MANKDKFTKIGFLFANNRLRKWMLGALIIFGICLLATVIILTAPLWIPSFTFTIALMTAAAPLLGMLIIGVGALAIGIYKYIYKKRSEPSKEEKMADSYSGIVKEVGDKDSKRTGANRTFLKVLPSEESQVEYIRRFKEFIRTEAEYSIRLDAVYRILNKYNKKASILAPVAAILSHSEKQERELCLLMKENYEAVAYNNLFLTIEKELNTITPENFAEQLVNFLKIISSDSFLKRLGHEAILVLYYDQFSKIVTKHERSFTEAAQKTKDEQKKSLNYDYGSDFVSGIVAPVQRVPKRDLLAKELLNNYAKHKPVANELVFGESAAAGEPIATDPVVDHLTLIHKLFQSDSELVNKHKSNVQNEQYREEATPDFFVGHFQVARDAIASRDKAAISIPDISLPEPEYIAIFKTLITTDRQSREQARKLVTKLDKLKPKEHKKLLSIDPLKKFRRFYRKYQQDVWEAMFSWEDAATKIKNINAANFANNFDQVAKILDSEAFTNCVKQMPALREQIQLAVDFLEAKHQEQAIDERTYNAIKKDLLCAEEAFVKIMELLNKLSIVYKEYANAANDNVAKETYLKIVNLNTKLYNLQEANNLLVPNADIQRLKNC